MLYNPCLAENVFIIVFTPFNRKIRPEKIFMSTYRRRERF